MHKVTTKRGRLSYTAYSQTPADGKRYEYLGGEVYVSPAPSIPHQYSCLLLQQQLVKYFMGPPLNALVFHAPAAVILSDTPPADAEIVEADVFIVKDRSSLTHQAMNGAPLVIVEIISPSRPWLDRKVKFERYAANGVVHYWIVDPIAETMECYRLVEAQYVLDTAGTGDEKLDVPAFPGLTIDLSPLWLRLDSSKA